MGVTTDKCRTGENKCTQFLSTGSVGAVCTAAANISDYAKQAAYKNVCGIQPDGLNMGKPFANLAPFHDALATVDCSCINYKNSTYAQKNLVGRDYRRFVNDFPKFDLPDEPYCWWPTCTDPSRSLTVTSQAGPTDASAHDPKCPAMVNNIRQITAGSSALPPGEPDTTPTSEDPKAESGDSGPGPGESGPGFGDSASPAGAKPKPWYAQTWFIAAASVLGVLIILGLYYWYTSPDPKQRMPAKRGSLQAKTSSLPAKTSSLPRITTRTALHTSVVPRTMTRTVVSVKK